MKDLVIVLVSLLAGTILIVIGAKGLKRGRVIRCKDCKWYDEQFSMCDNCGLPREQTFFCADGRKRIQAVKRE